jgi:Fe-S-cluster containining protein
VSALNQQKRFPAVGRPSAPGRASHFRSGVAIRAIADFECLGSDCEDQCCSGWNIPLSEDDLVRLRRATNADLGSRKALRSLLSTHRDSPVKGTVGQLDMGGDGRCSFLDTENLCRVQRTSGPDSIPTVCAVYPRSVSSVGSRFEMTPLVSCPEAVRRLILDPTGAELVTVDPDKYPRLVINHAVSTDSRDPFEVHMDEVRNLILELLGQKDIPFEVRFLFTAALAHGLHDFFGRGHPDFDESRLSATLTQFTDAETLARLWESFDGTDPEYTLGASVAYQVIAPRAVGSRRLTELFARAMSTFGSESGLELSFSERARASDTALGARWDSHFTRLSINSWLQGYLDSTTLMEHCRTLALRLQAIRFLVLGDPQLEEVRLLVKSGSAPLQHMERALDEAFVRVVYRFARATEHDPTFWAGVSSDLDGNGFTTFGHVARLIPRSMAR